MWEEGGSSIETGRQRQWALDLLGKLAEPMQSLIEESVINAYKKR